MPYYSISNIISIAKISQFLAATDIAKQKFLKGGTRNDKLPRMLYMERKAIEWMYTFNPNNTSLEGCAAYLLALCGKYLQEALDYLGQSGGIIINPSTGSTLSLRGIYVQFTVGDPQAPMTAGDTVLTLSYPRIVPNTVNVEMPQSNLPVSDPSQVSYTAVYATNSVTITFNQGVSDGELYIIKGLYLQ